MSLSSYWIQKDGAIPGTRPCKYSLVMVGGAYIQG